MLNSVLIKVCTIYFVVGYCKPVAIKDKTDNVHINVILRRVRIIIVAVETQRLVHNLSVSL